MGIKLSRSDSSRRGHYSGREKGFALAAVVLFVLLFTILGLAVLSMVSNEVALAQGSIKRTKAFYLAEAGLEVFNAKFSTGDFTAVSETSLGCGSYRVDFYPDDANVDYSYAIAMGTVGTQVRRIKVRVGFLAPPFEYSVYAGSVSGTPWTLVLGGEGDPIGVYGNYWDGSKWVYAKIGDHGGKDTINGNTYVDGDVWLHEESRVNPPLGDNPFGLEGDVDATGDIDVDVNDGAVICGDANDHAPSQAGPDLISMNYAVNNTHNVAQIFTDAGVTSGYLPAGHSLRDVFVKNPSDRGTECGITSGDDYFFEPSTGFVNGSPYTGDTPLHAGTDRVYYVDGDVWVHSKPTYGFKMDGKVTVVATGNIHICDNLQYADANNDILGLVALGKYDSSDHLISGGNVYFGDPGWGNMSVFSGMMFAANNFLYNTDPLGSVLKEPDSGFVITGNLTAMNEITIDRDWYTKSTWNGYTWVDERRPCHRAHASQIWVDAVTGAALTLTQQGTIEHYQMKLNYDDRVRSRATQPPGLPRGVGLIFEGLTNWEELP